MKVAIKIKLLCLINFKSSKQYGIPNTSVETTTSSVERIQTPSVEYEHSLK